MSKTGPSSYQATTGNPKYGFRQTIFYYYDSNGNTLYDNTPANYLSYINGNSYITHALRYPNYTYATTAPLQESLTFSANIDNLVYLMTNMPEGKRGFQPFAFNSYLERIYFFDEDKVFTPGDSSRSYYLRNWGTTTASNHYVSLWATAGISTQYNYWKSWFDVLSSRGVTIDAIYMDNEGSMFVGGDLTANRYNAIEADPRYGNSFFGFTSMREAYVAFGGSGFCYTNLNAAAWWSTQQFYKSINFTKAFGDSMLSVYPNAVLSDYAAYQGDFHVWKSGNYPTKLPSVSPLTLNSGDLFGTRVTYLKTIGNAASPVLYGWFRDLSNDWSSSFYIRGDNSKIVYYPNPSGPISYKDMFIVPGAWASFIQCMAELREAKRGNPNIPLTPWIGSLYMTADSYVLKSVGFDSSAFYGQSPAVVLSGLWRPLNVASTTKGFTAPDGSTSAFRILANALPTRNNVWFKGNISDISLESGTTSSFKINTIGNTGITSGLAYYYSGLTVGTTYVFSYEIDLDRGYTGSLARFIRWTTSDTASLAPLIPTSATTFANVPGITFNQILPVTGGNIFREGPIQYDSGNSGWTKVGWSFVPQTSGTNIGMHVYYGPNSSTTFGGYTTYIREPMLQEQISGITLNINSISNKLEGSTTYLLYYYNGITPGLTYYFSYYLDLNRGTTTAGTNFPFSIQSANHFYNSTYNINPGITLEQISPISESPYFTNAPVGFTTGISGWTKFEYRFITKTPHSDIEDNNSLAISLYRRNNFYSVTDSNSSLIGLSAYVWQPQLIVEYPNGSTQDLNVTPLDTEFTPESREWRVGPPGGFCDIQKGYDSRTNVFCTQRGGNSAYYYELIRHICLHGTHSLGFFNPQSFEDMGITGCKARGRINSTNERVYLSSGNTGFLREFELLNNCLQEVHDKIGGFTLATATYEKVDWNAPYFLSGAPDIKGNTWWWRLTVKTGHTLYINGNTLNASNPGIWIGTTGPSFAGVSFTVSPMHVPSEPGITAPTKDINYGNMSSLADLIASGTTFSRGSTASYIGPSGYLMYAGPNQPRFEYDESTLRPKGLLLERTTRNILNWSETFANTGGIENDWIDFGLTRVSGITSPQNIQNGIRFVATNGNATLIASKPVLNGTTGMRSFSFWARGVTGNEELYYTIDGGTSWTNVLNLSTQWKRMAYGPWFSGSTIEYPYAPLINDSVYQTHHVGFKLGGTGQAIEIWGAQVEDRTPLWSTISNAFNTTRKATSYIPTQGASAGRSVDVCTIPSSSVDTWLDTQKGTFVVESENASWTTGRFSMSSSTISNRVELNDGNWYYTWGGSGISSWSGLPVIGSYGYPTALFPLETPFKWAFTYSPPGLKISSAGQMSYTTWTGYKGFTTGTSISFIGPITGIDSIYIKRIRYWDYVMHDIDFKNMTRGGVDIVQWINRGDGGNLTIRNSKD